MIICTIFAMIKYSFTYFHSDNKMKNNFFFYQKLKKNQIIHFRLQYQVFGIIRYHRFNIHHWVFFNYVINGQNIFNAFLSLTLTINILLMIIVLNYSNIIINFWLFLITNLIEQTIDFFQLKNLRNYN